MAQRALVRRNRLLDILGAIPRDAAEVGVAEIDHHPGVSFGERLRRIDHESIVEACDRRLGAFGGVAELVIQQKNAHVHIHLRPFGRIGLAGEDLGRLLVVSFGTFQIVDRCSTRPFRIGHAKVVVDARPCLRRPLPRNDPQRLLVGGNRLVDVVGADTLDACPVGGTQSLLSRPPIARRFVPRE